MVYGGVPDWLSLQAVPLCVADGADLSLVHVTEGLRQWQNDEVDPLLAPGEELHGISPPSAFLTAALANAVAAGVRG
jgi:hypothetical protein